MGPKADWQVSEGDSGIAAGRRWSPVRPVCWTKASVRNQEGDDGKLLIIQESLLVEDTNPGLTANVTRWV